MSSPAEQFGVVSAALSMTFGTAEVIRRILKWRQKRFREQKRFRDIGVATEDIPAAAVEELGVSGAESWHESESGRYDNESCVWVDPSSTRHRRAASMSSGVSEDNAVTNPRPKFKVVIPPNVTPDVDRIDGPGTRVAGLIVVKDGLRLWPLRKNKRGKDHKD